MGVAGFRSNSTASVLQTAIDCAPDVKKANFFQLTSGEIVPKSSQTPNKLPNCCDLPLVKHLSRVKL
jgi:hypothetical protein